MSSILPTGVGTIYNMPIICAKIENNFEMWMMYYELFAIFAA
jgi:hypothetical protein